MRKIFVALALVLAVTACGNNQSGQSDSTQYGDSVRLGDSGLSFDTSAKDSVKAAKDSAKQAKKNR